MVLFVGKILIPRNEQIKMTYLCCPPTPFLNFHQDFLHLFFLVFFKVHPFICSCDLIWRHLFSINVVSMRYCQKSTCSISFEESNKNNIHTMERALPLCCLCHVCAPGISYMPRAQHHSAYLCPLLPSWLTGISSICSGGYEMCPIAEETWRMACHELWTIQGASEPTTPNIQTRDEERTLGGFALKWGKIWRVGRIIDAHSRGKIIFFTI